MPDIPKPHSPKNFIYTILRFIFIGVVVFLIIQTVLVLVDSKQNGFTTITLHASADNLTTNSIQYTFTFTARENYLGSISLPVTILRNGGINFQIWDKNSNTLHYQSNYNTDGLKLLSPYPFGFPIITNSKGQQYQVIIRPVNGISKALVSISSSTMTTRYSYPKDIILHNKKLLISFFIEKYLSLVSFSSIFISFIIALFLLNPKKAIRKLKNFAESLLIELGKEKIYKNAILFIVFVILFYSNLVNLKVSDALLWLIGLGLLYFFTFKIGEQLLFITPIFFFLLLIFSLLTKQVALINTLGSLVWLFLFAAFAQFFLNLLVSFFSNRNIEYIKSWIVKSFLIISIFVLLIAALDKTYMLGGDDSRIYFLYPQLFFNNYVISNGLNGGVSSVLNLLPTTSIAPFTIFAYFLKLLLGHFNIQMILLTANILGGLFFFYILLQYLFPSKRFEFFVTRILASLFYVFSIFNFYTLLNSLLIAQFLISLFPLSMYFYVRGIKENKYYLLGLCAVIWSVFSFVLISLPWFAGGFIAFIPLLIWLFWNEKRKFIIANILFGILLLLLNGYWIAATSYSSVTNNNIATNNSIVSTQFRNQNAQGILDTSEINKVFFPLVNLYHYDIQNNFHWPYLPIFTSWYLKLLVFNSAFIIFIFWVGTKIQQDPLKKVYLAASFSFLISVYLFTVNIGRSGINLFIFLNNHVPGFVMFRNMYDKFGYALALSFSLLLFASLLYFLTSKIEIIYKRIIIIFFLVIIFLNALPFLTGEFYSLPVWTTTNTYEKINSLNHDYLDLISYVGQNQNQSRYLWLPLNQGNISQIPDENDPNHIYNGVSPFLLLSGRNDYSGLMSFGDIGDVVKNDIVHRQYEQLGEIYQRYNVRYIIVNKTVTKDIKQSYICAENICKLQDKKYEKFFLGKKIKDFGSRYSLYEINPQFLNDNIYLTQDIKIFPTNQSLTYQRIANDRYLIHLSHLQNSEKVVFLNPFFPNWKLLGKDNTLLPKTNHMKAFGYANAWDIDKNTFTSKLSPSEYTKNSDGSVNIDIYLQFVQNRIDTFLLVLAIITYAGVIIYGLVGFLKERNNPKIL